MAEHGHGSPATLQVFRYRPGSRTVEAIIGDLQPTLPHDELTAHADEAMTSGTFMCYAVAQPGDFVADELCFVPQQDRCEILSIRTNGWQRHYGDHRRSLVEILSDLAAALACGRLRVLDAAEVARETAEGQHVLGFTIADTSTLAAAREAVEVILADAGLTDIERQRTILCISEAVTNTLLHGGGRGTMTLRRLPGRLRMIVADEGPGLDFLNWMEAPAASGQASMGYGFKIILDHLDAVGLHTGRAGTTLLLDRVTD
jgi:anti-sigma regulatory factor (Ser/Thr protein kinase)